MKNIENILVIGGTGKTGRKVVTKLIAKGHNVRVGSRNAAPAFDWDKPATWEGALNGMDKAYITFQPDLAVPGALDAIEELTRVAKRQGVKKLVLLSGKGEREAELCEQVIMHSGIDYTIVRASWFNQNFSENFFLDPIIDGFVALPQADIQIPFVDTEDIASVVVAALLNDTHNGKTYQLTGPSALNFKEAIDQIAIASNREIAFAHISLSTYVDVMKQQGVPSGFVWLIEYLFTEVLGNPNNSEVTNDIETVLGRKPIAFENYAQTTAKAGIWDAKTTAVG